jgi:hypothetical protein
MTGGTHWRSGQLPNDDLVAHPLGMSEQNTHAISKQLLFDVLRTAISERYDGSMVSSSVSRSVTVRFVRRRNLPALGHCLTVRR